MFRLARPISHTLRASRATTITGARSVTGITGLAKHPNPLPALVETYESTLKVLSTMPSSAVYRQGTEALTQRKLKIVQAALADKASGNAVEEVEKQLDEGIIEESLDIAMDELSLAGKMVEWKAWDPLVEKPALGQWEYFGQGPTQT